MLTLIQNDQEVPPGNFLEWLRELEIPIRIIKPYSGDDLPPFADISAIIVLGGAMGVHDSGRFPYLSAVTSHIRQAVIQEVPLLGICLGGQLLADALGAVVHSQRNGEMGLHSVEVLTSGGTDPLFQQIPESFPTFQWHNDCFEIPAGAVRLASSATCAQQAFRYGVSQYGLQFHPEVTSDIITSWIESTDMVDGASEILADFICKEEEYLTVSRRLLLNFLQVAHLLP